MDNKLTVKELAPYLPYGLMCNVMGMVEDDYEEPVVPIQFEIIGVTGSRVKARSIGMAVEQYIIYEEVFPILYPMSMLAQDITINGETFVPIVSLLKEQEKSWFQEHPTGSYSDISVDNDGYYALAFITLSANMRFSVHKHFPLDEPFSVVQKLLQWHFDVFGLLERELAIDKSTHQ